MLILNGVYQCLTYTVLNTYKIFFFKLMNTDHGRIIFFDYNLLKITAHKKRIFRYKKCLSQSHKKSNEIIRNEQLFRLIERV